jgi:iron complex outermembrane receptor protein
MRGVRRKPPSWRRTSQLANSYRQPGQGFVPVGAPDAQTPVAFVSGSNPTLQPELSKS